MDAETLRKRIGKRIRITQEIGGSLSIFNGEIKNVTENECEIIDKYGKPVVLINATIVRIQE